MHPLKEGCYAPRNQWYVAAWSSEITRKPMERWILNEPLVFYRTERGEAVALAGRCPHRGFPLGESSLVGDDIECGYHGLTFRADGSCSRIPTQEAIPASCRLRSYPVFEDWMWVWVWAGDPGLADPSLIPNHREISLTDPAYQNAGGNYWHVPGRYMLMHDNLLDGNHVPFLHRHSFGGDDGGAIQIPKIQSGPDWVECEFNQPDIQCPPFLSQLFGYEGRVRRTYRGRFYAPSLHIFYDQTWSIGTDSAGSKLLGTILHIHAVTPATLHSTHYFQGEGQNFSLGEPSLSEAFRSSDMVKRALEEDVTAARLIEEMIQRSGGTLSEILVRADSAAVKGRRVIESLIEKERQPVAV